MNQLVQEYVSGMRLAYNDAADFVDGLIEKLPEECKFFEDTLLTMRNAFREKGVNAGLEAERYLDTGKHN